MKRESHHSYKLVKIDCFPRYNGKKEIIKTGHFIFTKKVDSEIFDTKRSAEMEPGGKGKVIMFLFSGLFVCFLFTDIFETLICGFTTSYMKHTEERGHQYQYFTNTPVS